MFFFLNEFGKLVIIFCVRIFIVLDCRLYFCINVLLVKIVVVVSLEEGLRGGKKNYLYRVYFNSRILDEEFFLCGKKG